MKLFHFITNYLLKLVMWEPIQGDQKTDVIDFLLSDLLAIILCMSVGWSSGKSLRNSAMPLIHWTIPSLRLEVKQLTLYFMHCFRSESEDVKGNRVNWQLMLLPSQLLEDFMVFNINFMRLLIKGLSPVIVESGNIF